MTVCDFLGQMPQSTIQELRRTCRSQEAVQNVGGGLIKLR